MDLGGVQKPNDLGATRLGRQEIPRKVPTAPAPDPALQQPSPLVDGAALSEALIRGEAPAVQEVVAMLLDASLLTIRAAIHEYVMVEFGPDDDDTWETWETVESANLATATLQRIWKIAAAPSAATPPPAPEEVPGA